MLKLTRPNVAFNYSPKNKRAFISYSFRTSKSLYMCTFISCVDHPSASDVSLFSLEKTIEHDSTNNSHSCTSPSDSHLHSYYLLVSKQSEQKCSETSSTSFSSPHYWKHPLVRRKKYGPIMSLWLSQVPAIVISSPEAAELFLKTHDPVFADRPQTQAHDYLFYSSKGVAFSEYGSYWRNMKKLCTQHFYSASNQELFGHFRREEIRTVVKSLENAAKMGEVVDIIEKVHGLLEDIIYKMILGHNKDDQFDLKGLLSEGLRLVGAFNLVDFFAFVRST